MKMTSVLGVVALLGVLVMIQPSDGQSSTTCYYCSGFFTAGDVCNRPGQSTTTTLCSTVSGNPYCMTTITWTGSGSITRGCSNSSSGSSGSGWVTYTCSSNLCNTQSPAPRSATASLAVLIFAAFVALAFRNYA